MKKGVLTDCFRKTTAEGIMLAAQLKFDGVQIYATAGEFSPENLTKEKKLFYKKLLKENNLKVSALCGDFGGRGFETVKENELRIERTKRIIDLAEEFDSNIVTTHIGVIPEDKKDKKYKVMLSALNECGRYAAKRGVTVAVETGPETAPVLLNFLNDTECGVGVNLDPANFVMVTGQDPAEAVYLLKNFIVHTHLKDGKMRKKGEPEKIYESFATGGKNGINAAEYFIETPVGEGDVDFVKYISALRDIRYEGFLTVERETGENPFEDIKKVRQKMDEEGW